MEEKRECNNPAGQSWLTFIVPEAKVSIAFSAQNSFSVIT